MKKTKPISYTKEQLAEMALQREKAIFTLEKTVSDIWQVVEGSSDYNNHISKTFNENVKYYKTFNECKKYLDSLYTRAISRYTGERSDGYAYVQAPEIELEENIWQLAKQFPEHWYFMIEHIIGDADQADIYNHHGFSFVDNFIHNGIYDDWNLQVAQKNDSIVFLNFETPLNKKYKEEGYSIDYLNHKSMEKVMKYLNNYLNIETENEELDNKIINNVITTAQKKAIK